MGMNSSRIRKLEKTLGGGGRVIVVGHAREMTGADLEAVLHCEGIIPNAADLVVSLRRFGEGNSNQRVTIATGVR